MGSLERRIRAAQQLGGYQSLDDLAAKIGRESAGLSRKTLRRIASDTDARQAKDYELAWIAEATGVPLWFLEHGFAGRLGETSGTIDAIQARVEANGEALEVLLSGLANGGVAEQPKLEAALNHLAELRRHFEARRRTA